MKVKRILSIILTISIIATSFTSVVQISAQTEESAFNKAAQVIAAEDESAQTASKPEEPTEEFTINGEDDFASFMTTSELWESKYKIILSCDIDMKGKAFNPIKEFGGVFDGRGYTVSNFKIQNKSSGKGKNGELAFINTLDEYAEIKNVTFDNYTIECKSEIKEAAGLIVTNHGTISSVDIVNGRINNIDKKANAAGYVLNNEEEGIIENCSVGMNNKDANIKSGFVLTNTGKITKCSTTVSVSSKDIAGGFCGSNSGEINDCKAEGTVKASAKKGITICGGFVGENSGIIKNCSSTGAVEGQEFTGGFVGINSEKGEISSSKATCDVKSHTYIASINCGGFVGVDAGKIEDCSFDGKVDGCVDSEKVVGIGVGVTVGVILTIAGIFLTVKYINANKVYRDCINKYIEEKHSYELNVIKAFSCNDGNHRTVGKIQEKALNLIENNFKENISNLSSMIDSKNGEVIAQIKSCISGLIKECECYYTDVSDNFYRSEIESIIKESFIGYLKCYSNNYDSINNTQGLMNEGIKAIGDVIQNRHNFFEKLAFKKVMSIRKDDIYFLNFGFCTSLITAFVGGVAAGFTSGLTVGSKCANMGAFCGVNAGEISRCNANNSSLKVKSMYNKYSMCGGFVGINSETGTIKECSATGNEIHNKTYTGGHLGGFVGENSGKIENGTTTVSVANGKYTGGFCGNNSGEISVSRSEGNATANATAVETKCGGFVGNNDKQGKVSSCISTGSVTGQEYVGGFCGDNTGEISKSRSEGNAKASTKVNTNRCGGFVGENAGIVKDSNSKGSATGEEYVGGFAGVNKSEIIDCNASGKATAKTKTHTALAGGFVGENEKGTIISCTATGGADSRSSSGQAKAGGFVGINKASIMSSKASGKVYLSAGTFYKDDGCGGFVGKNDQGGIIDGCYAEATVETTNKKKGGGFVGEAKSKSTIKNSRSKAKIVTKSGTKSNTKFCENKDKKAVIAN